MDDTNDVVSMCHALPAHDAFFACSRNFGAVEAFFSMSAAHRAAPTVFVNEKSILANGIISSRNAVTPNLFTVSFTSIDQELTYAVYPPRF